MRKYNRKNDVLKSNRQILNDCRQKIERFVSNSRLRSYFSTYDRACLITEDEKKNRYIKKTP